MKSDGLLSTMIAAAVRAGQLANDSLHDNLVAERKGSRRNVFSTMDLLLERFLVNELESRFENPVIVAEEERQDEMPDDGQFFTIDSLDGTVNYLHGLSDWAVSISWFEAYRPGAGVIFAPVSRELYYASQGLGAYMNQEKLSVSKRAYEDSLFCISLSAENGSNSNRSQQLELFQVVNESSRGVLRTGSAALNLARLARGRVDGAWGKDAKIWDIASGLVIASEAGARVWTSTINWQDFTLDYVVGNPENFQDLYARFRSFF